MLQYTETTFQINSCSQFITSPPHHHHHYTMNKNHQFLMNHQQQRNPCWPGLFPTPAKSSNSNNNNFGDTNCMEQLLVHCATAIENNDATLAQQILWVLNNIAPQDGDSNQRLTCGFLRALIARAAKSGNKLLTAMVNIHSNSEDYNSSPLRRNHRFTIIELANYVDLTPWHRFGFTAANMAVLQAIEGYSVVHIVDLSLTHCMQIPTLVDSIATRLTDQGPPPLLKLTVVEAVDHRDLPPMLGVSYEELGFKLVNFARSRNVAMEFNLVHSSYSDGFSSLIEQLKMNQQLVRAENGEALVVNCHMMLHYIPEETLSSSNEVDPNSNDSMSAIQETTCLRTMFLKELRSLDPTLVILVDEDADFTSNDLVSRLRSAYNYLWIPYDTVDTFVPRGQSRHRQWYEADISWKIENVISHEGHQRIERLEPKCSWVQRMMGAGFRGVAFNDDAVREVKIMLDEHAAGWGLKKDQEDDHLVLTWKGHNVVFAGAWLPAAAAC